MTDASNQQPTPFDLNSDDVAARKRADLKWLFPEVFNEDKIDLDQLRRVVGDWVDEGTERFGLTWPGKAACMKVIQAPATGALRPDRDESVNFNESENVFIEGDNLEVLKLLQKAYFGKIKLIYIDPPYNTGSEFIYPDKYDENLETYLSYTNQTDNGGRRFSTNTESVGRFHTRWINMMYPRLYLAKNLLQDGGVIFVSIDDGEIDHLNMIMKQIFGEENELGRFIWKSRVSEDTRSKTGLSTDHEYILAFRKGEEGKLRGADKDLSKFDNPDNDPRGPWRSADLTGLATKDRRPNLHYDLVNPNTSVVYKCPEKGWRYEKSTMDQKIAEGRILWPSSTDGRPRHKLFRDDMGSKFKNISSLITKFNTSQGTKEANRIFGDGVFDFPKPSALIRELISQVCEDGDFCLDFFAGSNPFAHAIEVIRKTEGVNLRYIVVQLPEPVESGSPADARGYRTIADIGRSRIKRLLEIGELNKDQTGFRAFYLGESAFQRWNAESDIGEADLLSKLEGHATELKDVRNDDILFELLLKDGFELTTKVDEATIAGSKVSSVADGALLICLERNLTKEIIDALADLAEEQDAARVVCLDAGFQGNDQLKANAVQTFKSRLGHGEDGSMFRTV